MVATVETISEPELHSKRCGASISSAPPVVKKSGSMNSESGIWNTLIHREAAEVNGGPTRINDQQFGSSDDLFIDCWSLTIERSADAFGIKIAGAGSTPNQILCSGEYLDLGTGNYALRNRIYRQNTGTFLTADTTPGQLPYVYTSDNPVMFVDPSGRGLLSVAVDLTIELSLDVKNFAVSVYAGVRAADAAELAVISFNATAAGTENVVFGPRNLPDLELFSIGFGAGLLQGLVALRAPTIGAALGTAIENTANQYFSDPTHVFSWDSLARLALAETENVGGVLFVRGMLNEIDLSPLAKVLISTDVSLVRGDVIGLITLFEGH